MALTVLDGLSLLLSTWLRISLVRGLFLARPSRPLNELETWGHHESGFTVPVYATEPAGVQRRLAWLLFILPNLHWVAATRARIAVAREDNFFRFRCLFICY
jgi:hypothetical protein